MREGWGLECESCGRHHFKTLSTRRLENAVRRRKECAHCGCRVTTVETITPKRAPVVDAARPTG
jgi:transcriptional regulator NrdR family protein